MKLDEAGDDVDLQSAADHGGVDCVVEGGVEMALQRAQLWQRLVSTRRIQEAFHE